MRSILRSGGDAAAAPEATGIVDSTAASDDWKRKSKKRKN
jgi:hypothetical protein